MSLLNRSAARLASHSRPFCLRLSPTASTSSTRFAQSRRSEGTLASIGGSISHGLGSCVVAAVDSMSALHQAGLPWYVVFPVVAATLNFTIRLPSHYASRVLRQRTENLKPLKRAWMARVEAANIESGRKTSSLGTLRRMMVQSSRVNSAFGVTTLKRWSLIALPFFPVVLATEAIRRLSGSPMTGLGKMLSLDSVLDKVEGLQMQAQSLVDSTLAHGGCFWFTDLTVADPYYGLPLLCSLVLYVQTARQMTWSRLRTLLSIEKADNPEIVKLSNALGRLLLALPLFPLLLANLPSAVFLYLLPTFSLNVLNSFLLPKITPARLAKPEAPPKTEHRTGMVSRERYAIPKTRPKKSGHPGGSELRGAPE